MSPPGEANRSGVLLLAAGRFDAALAARIAEGKEPRLDMFQLRDELQATLLDFRALDQAPLFIRAARRAAGDSAALALLAVAAHPRATAFFTSGEDIGIPLALLLRARGLRTPHVMIAHTLAARKKRPFFTWLQAHKRIDRILCYSSNEERVMRDELGIPAAQLELIRYHADENFFRPMPEVEVEPDLLCSAGQLLRDYDCLIRATRDLPVRVNIAAGSPWIANPLQPRSALPPAVDWRRYDRFELRALYARAALAVVPIVENEYQTGISTMLEMMAMGKCLIVTRTRGQGDTVVDGETGIYVPPGDDRALRAAIEKMLARPDEAARIGANARRFVEENAGLDRFTGVLGDAVRGQLGGARAVP